MISVAFEFSVEAAAGEVIWSVTADVVREGSGYCADLTSAYPKEEAREYPSLYDVSDLESALGDEGEGRSLADVRQAAIDAFCDLGRDDLRQRQERWT